MCHLILLMPVFALVVFWIWSPVVAGTVYAAIFVLSLWMYVLIMQAMRRPVVDGAEEILHSIGEVMDVTDHTLRIRVHSELWNAESNDILHRGDHVKVVGMTGLTLQVKRLDDTVDNVPKHA